MIDTIIHGDVLDVMKKMKSASIDLIITSPPYNISADLKMHNSTKNRNWTPKLKDGFDGYSDDIPHDKYVKWQRSIIQECIRVLKNDGALFYNHKKTHTWWPFTLAYRHTGWIPCTSKHRMG